MAGIELGVRPIGEEPVHGDQDEMREELLFDAALGSGVKVLDDKDVLADLVQLLDAPPAMVDRHELRERIPVVGRHQGGAQAERAACDFVLEQPHFQWNDIEVGVLRVDVGSRAWGGVDGDLDVGLRAGEKLFDPG